MIARYGIMGALAVWHHCTMTMRHGRASFIEIYFFLPKRKLASEQGSKQAQASVEHARACGESEASR